MTVEKRIKAALEPFGYKVAQNQYEGNDKTYFVFNYTTVPVFFRDDAPGYDRVLVQVHFYAPNVLNTTELKRQVKLALQSAGFTYPSMVSAGDENGQHLVWECEIEEQINGIS